MARRWLVCIPLIAIAGLLAARHFAAVDSGGPDDGLLHLAGATALLRDGSYPVIQRPPLYAGLLGGLAQFQAAPITPAAPLAQELSSLTFFDVSAALQTPTYLQLVLLVHIGLWCATLLLMAQMLRSLGISWRKTALMLICALVPASWFMVGKISETILCQFLLCAGAAAWLNALQRSSTRSRVMLWTAAGVLFALTGVTKATFQLLLLVLVVSLCSRLRHTPRSQIAQVGLALLLPWLIIVGGWSIRNYTAHGFFGVSGISGVALSTRTALYLEQAADDFPEEVAIFRNIRDETFLYSERKQDVVYWGARASNWLIKERGLTYLEANDLLLRFNLSAIQAAPLNYAQTVSDSLLSFQFPSVNDQFPTVSRLLWSAAEVLLMTAFLLLSAVWMALWALRRAHIITAQWTALDTAIALLLLIYWYTAFVSSAIDVGKPEHRMTVQFVLPLVIALILTRLGSLQSRDAHSASTSNSGIA